MSSQQIILVATLIVFGIGYLAIGVLALILEAEMAAVFIAGWVTLAFLFLGKTEQLILLAEAIQKLR